MPTVSVVVGLLSVICLSCDSVVFVCIVSLGLVPDIKLFDMHTQTSAGVVKQFNKHTQTSFTNAVTKPGNTLFRCQQISSSDSQNKLHVCIKRFRRVVYKAIRRRLGKLETTNLPNVSPITPRHHTRKQLVPPSNAY